MERKPEQQESISPPGRRRLFNRTLGRAEWFRTQLAAAPSELRERFVPLLSAGSLWEHDELEPTERQHLQKIMAIESGALDIIPVGISGIPELREFVKSAADSEITQWQEIISQGPQARMPQSWKNAVRDAQKINLAMAKAESLE